MKLKIVKKIILLLPLFLLIISCGENDDLVPNADSKNTTSQKDTELTSLLWNPGPTIKSYLHINHDGGFPHAYNNSLSQLSDLSEGDYWELSGRPGDTYPEVYPLHGGGTINAPDDSAPSFLLITEGYENLSYGNYPGFDFWITDFIGTSTGIKVFNNTKYFDNTSKLREVGFLFTHWYNEAEEPRWAFKEQYKFGNFEQIRADFDARLDDYDPHLANDSIPTVALHADLRINYYDDEGEHVRGDLLSVIFCNPNGYDFNGNPSDSIYWQGWDPANDGPTEGDIIDGVPYRRISIHANKVGITNIPASPLGLSFTHINFDFVPLIETFLPPPPPGLDAVIVGYDIYSSTRGADITFSIKNINLLGKLD